MVVAALVTVACVICCYSLKASASLLQDTLQRWSSYAKECQQSHDSEPFLSGVYCNRTFDHYACWPDSLPDTKVAIPCPSYLPWIDKVEGGYVYRYCTRDGTWLTQDNVTAAWRDHSECLDDENNISTEGKETYLLHSLRLVYTTGYSVSLASLVVAMGILIMFRRLHCTRNYIHMNLFASFILRAISVLLKDAALTHNYTKRPQNASDWLGYFGYEGYTGCRATHVFMQYCIAANYFWLLVEGSYLHTLLTMCVLTEKKLIAFYVLLGWGTPIMFIIPWMVSKLIYENQGCWGINTWMGIWWIIRGPILFSIVVNFILFVKIIKILLSKLKAQQSKFSNYKSRLARSTLTLIPLLGIHEVVFIFLADEHATGRTRYVRLFIQLSFSSIQGFFVALLYCFSNGEVQSEFKKKLHLWHVKSRKVNELKCSQSSFTSMKNFSMEGGQLLFDRSGLYVGKKRPSRAELLHSKEAKRREGMGSTTTHSNLSDSQAVIEDTV
ncbi:unnamed protein product [Lampetra planeri]